MTTAALPLRELSDACVLDAASLELLLLEQGLTLLVAQHDHVVAQWPIRPARVAHDERRRVVFRKNDAGEWRGALLVATSDKSYDLVSFERRFRDLLHVGLWLGARAPKSAPASPTARMA